MEGVLYFPVTFSTVITATLRRFSSSDGKDSVEFGDCAVTIPQGFRLAEESSGEAVRKLFQRLFGVTFYADGNCAENEEHVSIIFHASDHFHYTVPSLTLSCTASVVDASGNKRFPQSFVAHHDRISEEKVEIPRAGFGFERYLRCKTLTDDPEELLPDDCLTLSLEVGIEYHHPILKKVYLFSGLYEEKGTGNCYLRTGSELERDLCKMSGVFRDLVEFAGNESKPELVPISREEHEGFTQLSRFLYTSVVPVTLSDIKQLYMLADKFDMQSIISFCHELLVSGLRAIDTLEALESVEENIHHISELAERFEDDKHLNVILEIYSDIKSNFGNDAGKVEAPFASFLETEWTCIHATGDLFLFNEIKRKSLKEADISSDTDILN